MNFTKYYVKILLLKDHKIKMLLLALISELHTPPFVFCLYIFRGSR